MKKSRAKAIVMLGTSPEAYGGIATVVGNYRDAGILEEWKVRYVVTHVQGSRFAKARVAAVAAFQLLFMLLAGRVGLLHVHLSSRASTWRKSFYILAAIIFRVPYLVHLHSPDFVRFFEHECGNYGKRLVRLVLCSATYVIALSSSWAKEIKKISPAARTTILFNSVPLPELKPCDRDRNASEGNLCNPPLILFLGRVGNRKGAFDLIRAVSVMGGNFRLVIGGDGEVEQARRLSEELGISEKIQVAGWLGKAEKEYLLARAAIFVLPSYDEGMPMAILEAMSWAVPVVTTPVGGYRKSSRTGKRGYWSVPAMSRD